MEAMFRPFRRSQTLTIAAVLNLEHAHGQGILRGIARGAGERPQVHLLRFSHTHMRDPAWFKSLEVDGWIVKISDAAEAAALQRVDRPVLDIGAEFPNHAFPRVTTDNLAAGEMAAGHFLRRGFRQFGYVGIRNHGASTLRGDGFQRAVTQVSLPSGRLDERFDAQDRATRTEVDHRLQQWVDTLPEPAGVFCADDVVAGRLLNACSALGRSMAPDVSILGCNNDLTEINASGVDLSSIELNTERIGYEAMRLMVAWLGGNPPPALTEFRPLKIVARRSTERFAVTDEPVLLALELIHERRAGTFSVNDVAKIAGISRRLLEMRFRRLLGCSIYEEVQRLRIERVIQLMANRELRLADVAREAGFSSAAKLSAAFGAVYRTTPTAFRSAHFGESPRS